MSSHGCLVGLLVFASCLPAFAAPKQPDLPRVESRVVEGTNDFRREQGLPSLRHNRALEETARAYAALMPRIGTFSHEADGTTPAVRASRHGYDHCAIAENIARQYSSQGFETTELARGLIDGWKQSPGHRRNMLDADMVETGVAVVPRTYKGHTDYFAVQLFGRPRSASVDFQVRNVAAAPVRYRVGDRAFTLAPRYTRTHTECAPRRLDFEGAAPQHFTTRKGDKFVVTSTRGEVTVRRE